MLGQHPELYAPAELECFTGQTLGECFAFSARVPIVTMHGLLRTVAQLQTGRQTNATIAGARQWLEQRSHWTGGQLVAWVEQQIAPLRLIEKSPIHCLRWSSLERLAFHCHGQPGLHLTRHPLVAMRSMIQAYRQRGQLPRHQDALLAWVQAHRNCLSYATQLADQPTLILRCEDLLAEPEATLKLVCAHLGIDAGVASISAMLHPERSVYACPGPSLAPSGNDPNWMRAPLLRRRSGAKDDGGEASGVGKLSDLEDVEPPLFLQVMQLAWQFGYS